MNIYFISGLGADRRAFNKIELPEGYVKCHIDWQPVGKDETLAEYAQRLSLVIDDSKPFLLAGLSFGGMVAQEICKIKQPVQLILFSTVRTRNELPYLYRAAGRLKLYKVIPPRLIHLTRPFLYWFLGPLNTEGRYLVKEFSKQLDSSFLIWALKQISCWKNALIFKPCLHIHGSEDRAFPIRLCNPSHVINASGHFAVITHFSQVNEILIRHLPRSVR